MMAFTQVSNIDSPLDSALLASKDLAITRRAIETVEGDPVLDFVKRLSYWARKVRDSFLPRFKSDGIVLNGEDTTLFMEVIKQLERIEPSADTLRLSRIHIAFMEMNDAKAWWDSQVSWQVHVLLTQWEKRFGDLNNLVEDLWAEGGPMSNIFIIQAPPPSFASTHPVKLSEQHQLCNSEQSKCFELAKVVRRIPDAVERAMETGHVGFEVGSWWIEPIAAFRDGIINIQDDLCGVTANKDEAFAIVLDSYDEQLSTTEGILRYKPSPLLPLRTRLFGNLITHNPIRVLRTETLYSNYKPRAGIRYEGLYKLLEYEVTAQVSGHDSPPWYIFTLQRAESQTPLTKVLEHPTSHEYDDWVTYHKYKEDHAIEPAAVDMNAPDQTIVPSSAIGVLLSSERKMNAGGRQEAQSGAQEKGTAVG